jgi:hypothetical protein
MSWLVAVLALLVLAAVVFAIGVGLGMLLGRRLDRIIDSRATESTPTADRQEKVADE